MSNWQWSLAVALCIASFIHHVIIWNWARRIDKLIITTLKLTDANKKFSKALKEAHELHRYGAMEEARELVSKAIEEYSNSVGTRVLATGNPSDMKGDK